MQYEKSLSNYIRLKKAGYFLFLFGIFFLCSSLFIAILFLIPALIIGSLLQIRNKELFNDKWSCSFFACGILILINALLQKFFLINNYKDIWNSDLTILGLANWLPCFWVFWAFQPFLETESKRKKFVIFLVSGTLPLIITGFGQYFFDWTGPFQTLNGLIIWYQRPIVNPGGLSGLFNNQNYAGSWLNLIWPFCIALVFEKTQSIFKRGVSISFLFSVALASFLTYSRNAWGGLLLALPLVIGQAKIIWILPLVTLFFIYLFTYLSGSLSIELLDSIKKFIPQKVYLEFAEEGYKNLDTTRLEILKSALQIATIRPFIGIGAASFTAIFAMRTNLYKGHSHNLISELAISYGIPVTLILLITVVILIIKSGVSIFQKKENKTANNFIDRAFWTSIFIFLLSQLVDIQYFDGKISILAWTLLCGIKKIKDQENNPFLENEHNL